VSAPHPTTKSDREGTTTLGDLLYADQSRPRVPEAEWLALVEAIAAGDQQALATLYERMHRLVFTLMLRIVQNTASAEELTVDVFHDVWRKAGTYDASGGTVVGWIMNQARSRALDRLRFERRKKRAHSPTAFEADGVASGADEALESHDQERLLRMALTALTATEREAIETAFFHDCTHSEVASRLNQPLGTIKTRIRTGLLKLRDRLLATGDE
jgi:RNA polymerase sigma-70 factor, ECF subfamily